MPFWPSPFTLFAIQDLALALAALPLFAIARIVTQSNRLSVAIAGVYLVWLPAFTGIFSFHWEAFIPLEFFLIFWLWLTHRYRWAIPVVLVAFVTLEVTPGPALPAGGLLSPRLVRLRVPVPVDQDSTPHDTKGWW